MPTGEALSGTPVLVATGAVVAVGAAAVVVVVAVAADWTITVPFMLG
jgi:hypothetical protein